MHYKYNEIMKVLNSGRQPFLVYNIDKEEILKKDFKGLDSFFKIITRVGEPLRQSCAIFCSGYDDVADELYEIPEVRKFVAKMFHRFPYALYYVSREVESENWLISSLADEVNSMFEGDYRVKQMNAYELYANFGVNTPQVKAMLTFKDDRLTHILKPILDHGKRIKDVDGSRDIAIEYAMQFDKSDRTLYELGIKHT